MQTPFWRYLYVLAGCGSNSNNICTQAKTENVN
jgi:hypothetical protein